MNSDQYLQNLTDALTAFDVHPTQANYDALTQAANEYQINVAMLDPQVAAEITDMAAHIQSQGLPAATVTEKAGLPWGTALVFAGLAWVVFGKSK